jgi:serine O-acetyltransferase
MSSQATKAERKDLWKRLHSRQPGFRIAVTEDLRVSSLHRGEGFEPRGGLHLAWRALRLCWVSDAFFAQVSYRLRMRLLARRVPILPRLLHRLSMVTAQVSIGDPVLLHPGIYVIHGQVVLDGLTEVGSGSVIGPWVTLGLKQGVLQGPTLGEDVFVGTGAKIIGPVTVGARAKVGANAVVTSDVAEGATAAGVPARQADSS